jgi:hypothetical protein
VSGDVDFSGSVNDWLAALPSYQKETMSGLLQGSSELEAAVQWLESAGPDQTAPLGAMRVGASLFLDKILSEMHALLCTSNQTYATERSQLLQRAQAGKASLIALMTAALAPHVGAAAVLLAPPVAIALAVVGRASRAATCEAIVALIEERRSVDDAPEHE